MTKKPAATYKKRAAYKRGLMGEHLAAMLLRLKGYRIIAMRYRNPAGEIDIIARRGKVVAFVEVKARSDEASALESISHKQKQRISRAADHWLAEQASKGKSFFGRFDVIVLGAGMIPHHIQGVWHVGEAGL